MDTFTIRIDLGNDAMRTASDIQRALVAITDRMLIDEVIEGDARMIIDRNGNTVGRYGFDLDLDQAVPTSGGNSFTVSPSVASAVAMRIYEDLRDRRGAAAWLAEIDDETLNEIDAAWTEIIRAGMVYAGLQAIGATAKREETELFERTISHAEYRLAVAVEAGQPVATREWAEALAALRTAMPKDDPLITGKTA